MKKNPQLFKTAAKILLIVIVLVCLVEVRLLFPLIFGISNYRLVNQLLFSQCKTLNWDTFYPNLSKMNYCEQDTDCLTIPLERDPFRQETIKPYWAFCTYVNRDKKEEALELYDDFQRCYGPLRRDSLIFGSIMGTNAYMHVGRKGCVDHNGDISNVSQIGPGKNGMKCIAQRCHAVWVRQTN